MKYWHRIRPQVPGYLLCSLTMMCVLLFVTERAHAGTADKPVCEGSLQTRIDAANPGDTVGLANGCIYRETVTVNKPLTLDGSGTGEIRGSDVWDSWSKSGSGWISSETAPKFPEQARYRCEDDGQRCRWPEQVFVDGEPLKQVAAEPQPGQFALDEGRRIILAADPAGRRVEVTTRMRWLLGASDDVTVQGVKMKHAAKDGLWNGGYSGWTVEDNDLSYAHEKNLALTLGKSLLARNNSLHDAGQLGLGSNDAKIRIVDNRLYGNNTERFDPGWEAGGMKIAQPLKVRISGNEVYKNKDMGIWIDVVNPRQESVEISNNRVHHQPWQGIRVEITKNFEVRDNLVWENGWEQGDTYNGSGISISGSHDGIVADNVLAWNASGISVVQQSRERAEEKDYQTTKNVRLVANKMIQDEIPGTSDHAAVLWNGDDRAVAEGALSIYDPVANNGGVNDEYWFDEPEGNTYRFKWADKFKDLADYNATPAEKGGRYLSEDEKQKLLKDHDLPTAHGDHSASEVGLVAVALSEIKRWVAKIFRK